MGLILNLPTKDDDWVSLVWVLQGYGRACYLMMWRQKDGPDAWILSARFIWDKDPNPELPNEHDRVMPAAAEKDCALTAGRIATTMLRQRELYGYETASLVVFKGTAKGLPAALTELGLALTIDVPRPGKGGAN